MLTFLVVLTILAPAGGSVVMIITIIDKKRRTKFTDFFGVEPPEKGALPEEKALVIGAVRKVLARDQDFLASRASEISGLATQIPAIPLKERQDQLRRIQDSTRIVEQRLGEKFALAKLFRVVPKETNLVDFLKQV